MAFGNVYTFGPTFRAENSNTQRHAAEFWMIEPEMAFADLNDYMDTAEAMIKFIIRRTMERCPDELKFFNSFVDKRFAGAAQPRDDVGVRPRQLYRSGETLSESSQDFKFPVYWGCDLATEHERYLTEQLFRKPVFVTDYPKEIKAFYMRLNDDGKTVAAADCLVPGIGEIIGGSQREERLELLERRMDELGMNRDDYWWYLDLRRYGGTKHAGYGLGFERMIMYLTGVSNIRDVLPHPARWATRIFKRESWRKRKKPDFGDAADLIAGSSGGGSAVACVCRRHALGRTGTQGENHGRSSGPAAPGGQRLGNSGIPLYQYGKI